MLENFPIQCSIAVFLVGLYLFRWLALFTCAMLTMLISSFMKRMETAYIATCGVILLPSVLYLYLDLEPLKYLSLALLVEAMPVLIDLSSKGISIFIVLILLLALAILSGCVLRRKTKAAT